MRILIIGSISVSVTIFTVALFFLPKRDIRLINGVNETLGRMFARWEKLSTLLSRTRVSLDVFILLHLLAIFLAIFQLISGTLQEDIWIRVFSPLYLLLAPLYLLMVMRSREYSKKALSDVEEIQRITHFLERTGAATKNINQYLAQTIKGPLGPYMKKIAAASMLSIDVKGEYQQIKSDFKDIREVVNYANISIQKQMTGKSDSLYQQQLEQIKQVKLARYKMKRSRNRIKLTLFALLVLTSFLSVTLYPMGQSFMNDLIRNMSN